MAVHVDSGPYRISEHRSLILCVYMCNAQIGQSTGYFVNEQFPKEISDRRRELLPKMHQAKRDGKTSWLSYDTLYIDGRPVRSER